MTRISKDYDVRKNEILDQAQAMFFQSGYDQTSVNAIIQAVGIAKGTFYYYFKSKEELLDAISERNAEPIRQFLVAIVEDESKNALEKINTFYNYTVNSKMQNIDTMKLALDVYYRQENILLRKKFVDRQMEMIKPYFIKLIEEGNNEGIFNVFYPDETVELILYMGVHTSDTMADYILNLDDTNLIINKILRLYSIYEVAFGKILGAPESSIKILDVEVLKKFFE